MQDFLNLFFSVLLVGLVCLVRKYDTTKLLKMISVFFGGEMWREFDKSYMHLPFIKL